MNGKPLIQIGIAFIFLGIVAFSYREGFEISSDPRVEIWSVHAGVDAMKTLARSPLMIGLVLASGIGLVVLGVRKSS